MYETSSQFLNSAIQNAIEPQGALETDFQTTVTNLFPNFNQVVSEDSITSSNLPAHFRSLTGQIPLVDWHKKNTTPEKDVVDSFHLAHEILLLVLQIVRVFMERRWILLPRKP